jgi:hypothetical protein
VGIETDRIDFRGGYQRASALRGLGGHEPRPGQIETGQPTSEREAPAQERAPINPMMP